MNPDHKVFSEFYSAQGKRIYYTPSSAWLEIQKGFLISIPFHKIISPDNAELNSLFVESKAWALKYPVKSSDFGFPSSLIMARYRGYSLSDLSSKSRNQVRKGLKNFVVRQVTERELKERGYSLNQKTYLRQGRRDPNENQLRWYQFCEACYKVSGVKVFGAFRGDQLGAYLVLLETSTAIEIVLQSSDSDLLSLCPNNALTFVVTAEYCSRADGVPICYGLGSLENTESLDRFKINMGYKFEGINQRIVFNRFAASFVNRFSLFCFKYIGSLLFANRYFFKKGVALMFNFLNQR